MLDENEFLSPFGIRSVSRYHASHPYVYYVDGAEYRVDYLPAESNTGMFGGNSNWRGPIWFPVNALIIRALLQFYLYYGDNFKVECPTGSGTMMNLFEVSREITLRLERIFLRDEHGRRPVYGGHTRSAARVRPPSHGHRLRRGGHQRLWLLGARGSAQAMTVPRRVWRHRRGWLAALALAVVAGVIVAAVLAAGSPSPTTAANAAKASAGAATVRRRNLVQTDTEAGTLSYANPQTVYDRLSGTVTWLPSVGQVIQPGGCSTASTASRSSS